MVSESPDILIFVLSIFFLPSYAFLYKINAQIAVNSEKLKNCEKRLSKLEGVKT